MIDFDAQTWCYRCWKTAAERSAQNGDLAPFCVNIPFVMVYCRRFAPTPQRPSPLLAVQEALRRRWAARLGLPLDSEEQP